MNPKEFDAKTLERMKKYLMDGVSRGSVCEMFHIGPRTLARLCGAAKEVVPSTKRGRTLTPGEVELIVTWGKTGITVRDLAKKIGITHVLISRTLREHGVPLRRRGHHSLTD